MIGILFTTGLDAYSQQSVSIGTNTVAQSAMLDLSSGTKGLLPPRLTYTERNGISNPVAGLIIWCSNCNVKGEMQVYDGVEWKKISDGNAAAPVTPRMGVSTVPLRDNN